MSIHQTKQQSDLEKRLRLLRQQVYGRSANQYISKSVSQKDSESDTPTHSLREASRPTDTLILSDFTYLRHDLFKILFLSSVAIGAQIILFYLMQHNLLKFNF